MRWGVESGLPIEPNTYNVKKIILMLQAQDSARPHLKLCMVMDKRLGRSRRHIIRGIIKEPLERACAASDHGSYLPLTSVSHGRLTLTRVCDGSGNYSRRWLQTRSSAANEGGKEGKGFRVRDTGPFLSQDRVKVSSHMIAIRDCRSTLPLMIIHLIETTGFKPSSNPRKPLPP
jgi:hypothetical protein